MGECVIVYGKSGSGKSRSLLNFGEDEIFLVNVNGDETENGDAANAGDDNGDRTGTEPTQQN